MTKLCEMIMECRAMKGMDRLVLYGWAAQLEEKRHAALLQGDRGWLYTQGLPSQTLNSYRKLLAAFPNP